MSISFTLGSQRKRGSFFGIWAKSDPACSIVVMWFKIFKTEKTIEIELVRLSEVCGKVLSEKYAYKSVIVQCY